MLSEALTLAGLIGMFVSTGIIIGSEYSMPPVPIGWLVGMVFTIVGSAISIASTIHIVNKKYNRLPIGILGVAIIVMGVRNLIIYPLEYPLCPCPPGYYGEECLPCKCQRGVCDDGVEGTGECLCPVGYDGAYCEVCGATFTGKECNECRRGWTGNCDVCDYGYVGAQCNVCDNRYITEYDDIGILCRDCKPNYFGPRCQKCEPCGDPFAVCRDNIWHKANAYTDTCTSNGQTCSSEDDCDSFNCKGLCTLNGVTDGNTCELDTDCAMGTCEYKTCCLEDKYGNGECQCSREGYWGPRCHKCPGFDGVYNATICSSHGTCTALYAGDEYMELVCECNDDWTGELCGCKEENGRCVSCADGFYGNECLPCPGGGGISQCNTHGVCSDTISGTGQCTCDVDLKYNGLGGWTGASCEECLGEFWGDQCKTCPDIMEVGCTKAGFTKLPNGNCLTSCGNKECNNNGMCV